MRHRLVAQLLMHRDSLIYTILKRQDTSTGNKELHQTVLDSLSSEDYEGFYHSIFNSFYFNKPLSGVIYCMNISSEDKQKLIDNYNTITESL